MQRIVITGTGTGVGKTYVAAALRRELAAHAPTRGLKPIESGYVPDSSDAHQLGGPEWVRPLYTFDEPLSPHLAARRAGRSLDLDAIRSWVEDHAAQVSHVVVETAGGLYSPLTDGGANNADLVRALEPCRWVLVAPNRLGVLHDVLVCLEASRVRHRLPDFVVLNTIEIDASSESNRSELERCVDSGVQVLDWDPVALGARLLPP